MTNVRASTGMSLEEIVRAGRDWAEREAANVRDHMWEHEWLPTWHDALPLVQGDYDIEEDRQLIARAINEAANEAWEDYREAAAHAATLFDDDEVVS